MSTKKSALKESTDISCLRFYSTADTVEAAASAAAAAAAAVPGCCQAKQLVQSFSIKRIKTFCHYDSFFIENRGKYVSIYM